MKCIFALKTYMYASRGMETIDIWVKKIYRIITKFITQLDSADYIYRWIL